MRAVSRLASGVRRQFLRRSESEGRKALPSTRSTMPCSAVRTSSASLHTAVSAPSTPLRSARVEHSPSKVSAMLNTFDPVQVSLLQEECIVVDENDKVVGMSSKKNCHLMTNINQGLLHRAFSVFLFNSDGELLIQQRSDAKITFPGLYTNTCCSHPLAIPSELTDNPIEGVKIAAQRRMYIELGIPPEELPLECFHYLTRIKYIAPSDGMWGEHEVDYILFVQKDIKVMRPNPNEIKTLRYLNKNDMKTFVGDLENKGEQLTPWFKLIMNSFLEKWWNNLDNLEKFESHDVIHKLN